jgi:magnesium-transporting ATPase (P-type)
MTSDSGPERKFWQITLADLERQLGAGRNGLSSAEAAERLLRYGPNTLEERRRLSLPLKFLSRFRNPLVIVLLAAAVISALTGDLTSFIIISTIVLMSAALDTVQEFRAEQAAESLKVSVSLKEQVLRDGQEVTVLGQDLVLGDVVLLAAGDLVPADGRLLEARDLFVNEALLTGESYPAEKHARDEGVDNPEVASATNAAFMGSSVMNGSARLMVCGTGLATQLGQISRSLRRAPPPSALDQGAHRFGMLIVHFTGALVLFVLLINLLFHRPWLESFLFAVALAVGLTPELLPMIISVTLARGAIRMAKVQVIVKRLGAIHDLGSMDVLCTDKTGTLTEAKISLARQVAQKDVNILLTSYLTPESRIQIWRTVQERVAQIAPFLRLDTDPYPVLSAGKLYWIQDAYTDSDQFPYSYLHVAGFGDNLNYIRNSVKVVVDMYDGTVSFYVMDPTDPVLAVYPRAFPGVFKDLDQLSADLNRHLRYPEDLFAIQTDQYKTFHMTDPQVFYNREDLWMTPKETYAAR